MRGWRIFINVKRSWIRLSNWPCFTSFLFWLDNQKRYQVDWICPNLLFCRNLTADMDGFLQKSPFSQAYFGENVQMKISFASFLFLYDGQRLTNNGVAFFWLDENRAILRRRFPFYGQGIRGFFDSKAKVSFLWARKFVQLLWRYDCLQPQSFSKHFRLAVAKEPRVGWY